MRDQGLLGREAELLDQRLGTGHDVQQPDPAVIGDEQQRREDHDLQDRAGREGTAAVPPVDQDAGWRGEQRLREHGDDEHPGRGEGGPSEVVDEVDQTDAEQVVAQRRHQVRRREQPVVPVGRQQPPESAHPRASRRDISQLARRYIAFGALASAPRPRRPREVGEASRPEARRPCGAPLRLLRRGQQRRSSRGWEGDRTMADVSTATITSTAADTFARFVGVLEGALDDHDADGADAGVPAAPVPLPRRPAGPARRRASRLPRCAGGCCSSGRPTGSSPPTMTSCASRSRPATPATRRSRGPSGAPSGRARPGGG